MTKISEDVYEVKSGQRFEVIITLLNNGDVPWLSSVVCLKSIGGVNWGLQNGLFPVDVPKVSSGMDYPFRLPLTAPATRGTTEYNFQWQMYEIRADVKEFGELSHSVRIRVVP